MNSTQPFLELRSIRKNYSNLTVINDCNLEIHRGEFVTLLGPSGCGKTTTLRMMAGFIRPDAGTIRLGDRILSSDSVFVPPERRDIGMVFQSYAVWPHMSVRANIELPLRLRHIKGAEMRQRVDEALDLCRLRDYADRDPHQLSGGQLQRVALARALVYKPQLILLDEPLSNLDVALREELRHELHLLHKKTGATFVLVTHDQVEAMSLSDRVVVMRNGEIQQIGTPRDLYRSPCNDFVAQFVGAANLLNGSVDSIVSGERPRVDVRVGAFIVAVRPWTGVQKGQRVTLAIHPEAIRLSDVALDGDNQFEGSVKAAYFLGRTQEALVSVDGIELRAVQIREQTIREGGRVLIKISPDAIIALPNPPAAAQSPESEDLSGVATNIKILKRKIA